MAKRFLHISFDFADADPQVEKLQPVFDKAIDWLRYMPTCWIVWTSTSAYSAASLLPYQRRAAASQLADRRRQSQKRYVRTA